MRYIYSGINIYIYPICSMVLVYKNLQNWMILFGHMLGFISNTWSIWVLEMEWICPSVSADCSILQCMYVMGSKHTI